VDFFETTAIMKAAYIEQPGPAESIHYGELPLASPRAHEVLVRTLAVAVNHVDTYIRSGALASPLPRPFIVGRDVVGVVEATGAGVQNLTEGDVVWSNCLGIEGLQGTFAEYVVAPEERLYRLPEGVEPCEAVAVVHSALTAIIGLFTKAGLTAGDTLFVHGGSGGVGLAAIQLAKACGARVAVTAGNEAKAACCRRMGADRVIMYRQEDIAEGIRDFAPQGIDVFFETTPAFDPQQTLPMMRKHGRIVIIAGRNHRCTFPLWPFYTRNCSMHGFIVTGTGIEGLRRYARQINAWLAAGNLKATIHCTLHLSQAAEAHRMQEHGGLLGKIVLTPGE